MSVKHPNRNLSILYCQNVEKDYKPQTKGELSPEDQTFNRYSNKFDIPKA